MLDLFLNERDNLKVDEILAQDNSIKYNLLIIY